MLIYPSRSWSIAIAALLYFQAASKVAHGFAPFVGTCRKRFDQASVWAARPAPFPTTAITGVAKNKDMDEINAVSMITFTFDTEDVVVRPYHDYLTDLLACAKVTSYDETAVERALAIFDNMLQATLVIQEGDNNNNNSNNNNNNNNNNKNNNFNDDTDLEMDTAVYNALLETFAYSKRTDAIEQTRHILDRMVDGDQVPLPNDESYGYVMEAYINANDWSGLDMYWQELQEFAQQHPTFELTTLLRNKRLRSLALQGLGIQAEALLRETIQIDPALVNHKSWVHVLRAYANAMINAKSAPFTSFPSQSMEDARTVDNGCLKKMLNLMQEMTALSTSEDYALHWKPSLEAYNALLKAEAQRIVVTADDSNQRAHRAEMIFYEYMKKHTAEQEMAKNATESAHYPPPNADTFFYTLQAQRGVRRPKVAYLWHLQMATWERARQSAASVGTLRSLVPSIRNLNAATAALARSTIPTKAADCQTMVKQMEHIRKLYEADLSASRQTHKYDSSSMAAPIALIPNGATYKNVLRACANTSRKVSSRRDTLHALEIALETQKKLKSEGQMDSIAYKLLLQTVGRQEEASRRDNLATEIFQECCAAGVVEAGVVTAFERAASDSVALSQLGGFGEDLLKLPERWTANLSSRRQAMGALFSTTMSTWALLTPQDASAACLPGDLSKECIGVYKVPMDDAISGMVGTKEALERNAPGLKYVPPVTMPQSVSDALEILRAQRVAADDIRSVVTRGSLEEAGIKILNLVPRVTAAGRVVVLNVMRTSTLSDGAKEVQLLKLQSKLDETIGCFGQVDVSIGQGLRGELGVVTIAQLNILSDLKEAIIAFDEFLDQIPRGEK